MSQSQQVTTTNPDSLNYGAMEQSTDLQILQDSFDSLFTSTLLFEQQSLIELVTSLG